MNQDQLKRQVGQAALAYVEEDSILGVGTGSTVNAFIEAMAEQRIQIDAAVSSSEATSKMLSTHGFRVIELNQTGTLDTYIDGADEFDPHRRLIKGGGGALTREKIIAGASRKFVCIADSSKQVKVLGQFPLPIEVIPMARSHVAREMIRLGGQPEWRENFVTDNGNWILDVHNLDLVDPVAMERNINSIAGVVTAGLFAQRPADVILVSSERGIEKI